MADFDQDDMTSRIKTARDAGFSDGDIWQALQDEQKSPFAPRIKAAIAAGHSLDDVASTLGLDPSVNAPPKGSVANVLLDFGTGGLGKYAAQAGAMEAGQTVDEAKAARDAFDPDLAAYKARNPAAEPVVGALASIPMTLAGLGGASALTRAALSGAPRAASFLMGESGGLARVPSLAASGALQGAEAGALTSGTNDQPFGQDVAQGAALGGALGPTGALLRGLTPPAFSARNIDPAVAQTVNDVEGLGVKVPLPFFEKGMPARMKAGDWEKELGDYTQAFSKTMGGNSRTLTAGDMQSLKVSNSAEFDRLKPQLAISSADPSLLPDLANIETEARSTLSPKSTELDSVLHSLNEVRSEMRNASFRPPIMTATGSSPGTIPGERYANMIGQNGVIGKLSDSNNGSLKYFGSKIRSSLDDAVARATPADVVSDFQTAREHWKNMRAFEDLAAKAGPSGVIDPTQVEGAARGAYSQYAFGALPDDVETLAKAGRLMPQPTIQGGTKQPSAFSTMGSLAIHPLAVAGEVGLPVYLLGAPSWGTGAAMVAAEAPAAIKAGAKGILQSNWYRRMVLNKLAHGNQGPSNLLIAPSVAAMNAGTGR